MTYLVTEKKWKNSHNRLSCFDKLYRQQTIKGLNVSVNDLTFAELQIFVIIKDINMFFDNTYHHKILVKISFCSFCCSLVFLLLSITIGSDSNKTILFILILIYRIIERNGKSNHLSKSTQPHLSQVFN